MSLFSVAFFQDVAWLVSCRTVPGVIADAKECFQFALRFLRCRQARDTRHHGRYDQRRTVCSDTVAALGVDTDSGLFM